MFLTHSGQNLNKPIFLNVLYSVHTPPPLPQHPPSTKLEKMKIINNKENHNFCVKFSNTPSASLFLLSHFCKCHYYSSLLISWPPNSSHPSCFSSQPSLFRPPPPLLKSAHTRATHRQPAPATTTLRRLQLHRHNLSLIILLHSPLSLLLAVASTSTIRRQISSTAASRRPLRSPSSRGSRTTTESLPTVINPRRQELSEDPRR